MTEEKKKTLSEIHRDHHDENWPMLHWRAWGSWFSWGSPVGLGLFFLLGSLAAAILIFVIKI